VVEQLLARQHAVHDAEPLRLLGEEDAAGEEQVERVGRPDQAGQQPRAAVLGDQPAPRERGRELDPRRREAQVAHQRLHEPDPRARAVDRRDDRLADRQRERLRPRRRRGLGAVAAALPRAQRGQRLHVEARAEPAAGAGDHDDAGLGVAVGLGQEVEVARLHLVRPRVHPVRTVERQDADAVADLAQDGVAHVARMMTTTARTSSPSQNSPTTSGLCPAQKPGLDCERECRPSGGSPTQSSSSSQFGRFMNTGVPD
jgi:hypothetical protein